MGIERWRGRVALVTGASSGIGRATALMLGREGLRVVVTGRDRERLAAVAAAIEDEGGEVLAIPADLRDEASITALFTELRTRWGGVDAIVNSAGVASFDSCMEGTTEAWRNMLEVNVLGLMICTREAVADMRRREFAGQVIHLSSMSGHFVTKQVGVYAATKFAVRALTMALRQELSDSDSGIRISSISPGRVATEFLENMADSPEEAQEMRAAYRALDPEDVATQVRWILSQPPHVQIHDILLRSATQPI